jgi:hypothetical protein
MIYMMTTIAVLTAPVTAVYYPSFSRVAQTTTTNNGYALAFLKYRGTQNILTGNVMDNLVVQICYPLGNPAGIKSYAPDASLSPYVDPNYVSTLNRVFANAVSVTKDKEDKYLLFADTQIYDSFDEKVISSNVGVYRGEYSSWTSQQIIYPPSQFKEASFFGSGIDYDQDSKVLAITCPGCNYTTAKDGFSSGAVFLYEKKGSKDEFVNTAILTPSDVLNSQGFRGHTFANIGAWGQSVQIHDGNLIWQGVRGLANFPYLVFSKIGGKWKHVQTISLESTLEELDTPWESRAQLYDDTIVVGNPRSAPAVGYVSIFRSSTKDSKGKPQPKQWSLLQTLRPSNTGDLFGNAVAIEKNTLAVANSLSELWIYKRPTYEGSWSLQQLLSTDAPIIDIEIVGSSIATTDFTPAAAAAEVVVSLISENPRWDCLVVSVEDHFGDGWDGAKLRVDVPNAEVDYFYPRCDTANPLQFRYCPSDRSDEGLYQFSIEGASRARFYWELLWRVFDESTGEWYTGNWDTKLDFDWSSDENKFEARKATKLLPNNVTCQNCKFRPTSKPSAHLRALNGRDDKTHHPTISPAPTAVTNSKSIWQTLALAVTTIGADLFVDHHKTTSYYISDGKGRRLVSTGTLCPAAVAAGETCWEDLDDGDYIVRLGGALNPDVGGATLSFCKLVTPIKTRTQLMIRIENNDCQVVTYVTREAFCNRNLRIDILTYVELNLVGVYTTEGITAAGLKAMFASAISQTSSVRIESLLQSPAGIAASVTLSTESMSVDFNDAESLQTYNSQLQYALQNGLTAMRGAAQAEVHASPLGSITAIELVEVHMVGTEEIPVSLSSAPLVTDTSYDRTQSTPVSTSSASAPSPFVLAGFLVAILGVGLIALVTLRHTTIPDASAGSPLIAVSVCDASLTDTSTASPAKNVKKKIASKELTAGDIKELVDAVRDRIIFRLTIFSLVAVFFCFI